MNQQFLDDLQLLQNSPQPEAPSTLATSTSLLLNNPEFISHTLMIRSITEPRLEMHNLDKTNKYLVAIDREISSITKFVKDIYKRRFPEIESVVVNPVQYVKTVTLIEENVKVKEKELSFLSPHQALSVTLAISSTHDSLEPKDIAQLRKSCEEVLQLNAYRDELFRFVEASINRVCPNLCRLLGTVVACKLVTIAGGIGELANTPACNIQLLGGERGPNIGFGLMTRNHTGVFGGIDMVQKAPRQYQMELVRMLANKTAIAARVDKLGACPSGFEGDKLRQELLERFEKIQERGLVAKERALPIPGEQPKKKRGGKRHRKQKELMGMTDVKKLQNRMKFGEMEEETLEGVGKGMLKNSGHIRVQIKKTQKLNPSKKILAQLKRNQQAGMQSTLEFDSTHQMELLNPGRVVSQKGTESYFNQASGFKTVHQDKMSRM